MNWADPPLGVAAVERELRAAKARRPEQWGNLTEGQAGTLGRLIDTYLESCFGPEMNHVFALLIGVQPPGLDQGCVIELLSAMSPNQTKRMVKEWLASVK